MSIWIEWLKQKELINPKQVKTKNIFEDDKPKNKTFFSLNKQVDKIYDKLRYLPKKKRRVMKILRNTKMLNICQKGKTL